MNIAPMLRTGELDGSWPLSTYAPFTARMARREGLVAHQLRQLVHQGLVRHLIQNVYVASCRRDSTLLRCEALALVVPEDCVVVDRHAGWLLEAEMVLAPNEHINLQPISMFRPSGHGRLRNDLARSGERNLLATDIIEVNGLSVTTPIRTAWDLGRVRSPDRAIAGIDAMLRLQQFTREELLDGIERFRGMRWISTLRFIAPLGDGRSESPGESVLRLRWIEAGLLCPRPQLEVWRGGILLARLDIANDLLRYAAEYDGEEWHGTPEQQDHDQARRTAVSEDDWHIDAFVAADVFGPQADAISRLRAGAAEARRLFGPIAS
jgi:hypothetical protein